MNSNKKVLLITGISSGIGAAFLELAKVNLSEYFIVGLGRNDLEGYSNEKYKFYKLDLKNDAEIKTVCNQIKNDFERIDVIINNAGYGLKSTIEDAEIDQFKELFQVNLFSSIEIINEFLPLMREQKSGHIINVSSIGAIIATPTLGYYAATKSAINKISDVLRQEVEKYGIKVSLFSPGTVRSKFGKNFELTNNIENSPYTDLYNEWNNRFGNFFKRHDTSEQAALKLIHLVNNPKDNYFFNLRDRLMVLIKQSSQRNWVNKLIHKLFLKPN